MRTKTPIFLALDTEDNSNGKLYLVNFFDGQRHTTFKNADRAINWLLEFTESRTGNKQGISIWAVNAEYDLNNLFKTNNDLITRRYIDSRFISARLRGRNVSFFDTLNHWKLSVEKMGERIGLKKLDSGGNYNNVEYCRRDTEITYKFVEKMLGYYQTLGVDASSTIGSTTLKLFRTKYHFKKFEEFDETEIEFMREAARGGRVEIFDTNPVWGRIRYFDFNSLYPSQMLKPVPRLGSRYFTKVPHVDHCEGIADVTLRTPKSMAIPYLGTIREGKFIFPLGTWRGRYTYFELREAAKLGYTFRVHTALEFAGRPQPTMRNFVLELYERRKLANESGDKLLAETLKYLMNNLFGKWNQGNENTSVLPFVPGRLKPGDVYSPKNPEAILRKIKTGYPPHTNVIWAAYITAYARDALWKALSKVNKRGGRLIYCDTDSIIFDSTKSIFSNSTELGELKSEGEFCFAHFKQPKMYKLISKQDEAHYKTKGVPKKFQCDFFENDFAFFDSPNRFKQSLRKAIQGAGGDRIADYVNIWEARLKTINSEYSKREVLKDGTTRPIVI